MSESANSLDRHQVVGHRAAMAQRIEGGNPRTHQRCGFGSIERLRHPRQCFHGRHHIFLIAAVVTDSGNLEVCAVSEVAAPASQTGAVLPAVPANSHSLALRPLGYARAGCVNYACHFVSRHARIHNARPGAFLGQHIAVTDSASLHANPDLARSRLRDFPLHNLEVGSCLGYLCNFHFWHCLSPCAPVKTGEV